MNLGKRPVFISLLGALEAPKEYEPAKLSVRQEGKASFKIDVPFSDFLFSSSITRLDRSLLVVSLWCCNTNWAPNEAHFSQLVMVMLSSKARLYFAPCRLST
jgi:hypothetical protein